MEHFYRRTFLRHAPLRYAVMLAPHAAQRLDQKYNERYGQITDAMIHRHLAGDITLAAPATVDGQAYLLPLDVDAGGIHAIHQLIEAARIRSLWAFGQSCPRPGWDDADQRGYVWVPFAELADATQLQLLGAQLIAAVLQDGWKIEARAHAAVTRLPLARHTHTGRFGDLVLPDRMLNIDTDPPAALVALRRVFRENRVKSLPPLPAPPRRHAPQHTLHTEAGVTIDRYNQDHDLVALLEHYGARPTLGNRRLMHCCGHADDRRASLLLWRHRSGVLHCKCLSQNHNCPLSGHMRDAFSVYCVLEHLTTEDALRCLNGKEVAR